MRIALIGYGKMGREIEEIALERGHSISLRSDSTHPFRAEDLKETDVAIEFSTPETAVKHIFRCFDARIPVVCGTTGWYGRFNEVKHRCEEEAQSLFHATNFSFGVNVFFEINRLLARYMRDAEAYSSRITEIHHTEKKDAPSGTGISLAEIILDEVNRYTEWVNDLATQPGQLPLLSQRLPGVPGTHEVVWESEVDELKLIHTAHNRKGFALGAVMAAEWLHHKTGVFTMRHMLKL